MGIWPNQNFELLVDVECLTGSACAPTENTVYPLFDRSICDANYSEGHAVKDDEDAYYKEWLIRTGSEARPLGVKVTARHDHG